MKETKSTQEQQNMGLFRRGIRIKSLCIILFAIAFFAFLFSMIQIQQTTDNTAELYELEQERQSCDEAIQQFMDGSDYLTTEIQQFVVQGERVHMDNYWEEVLVTKSRDKALAVILGSDITTDERNAAIAGKAESDTLINGEIWAMRMVSEAIGIAEKDMPDNVAAFQLEAEDAGLSATQKQEKAIAYIFGPEYSTVKDSIQSKVNSFRNELSKRYSEETLISLEKSESTSFTMKMSNLGVFIAFILAILFFVWQGLIPMVEYAREIRKHETGQSIALNVKGAWEIKEFARAFNALSVKMDSYTRSLARLGYIDYLTDVPNRANITEYVEKMIEDKKFPLGVLIADIDDFKRFNDTFGHATGDKVLQHVAKAVCGVQDPKTGISGRLCGEEFVIVCQNANEESLNQTAEQILQNVRRIAASDVGMPAESGFKIRVSIGGMIWDGDQEDGFISLLSKADKALYISKETGKDRYTFSM